MTDKTPRAWDGALEQEFYTPEEIAASDARVGKAHRMLYREKVIEGLKFTLEESGWDANAAYDQELMIQAVADAIALLKAQEPRVMTLEEVEEGQAYWLEMRGIASEYAICKMNDHGDSAFLDFSVQHGDKTLESVGYGKRFRCWTSRPTDEQREATPWD